MILIFSEYLKMFFVFHFMVSLVTHPGHDPTPIDFGFILN